MIKNMKNKFKMAIILKSKFFHKIIKNQRFNQNMMKVKILIKLKKLLLSSKIQLNKLINKAMDQNS